MDAQLDKRLDRIEEKLNAVLYAEQYNAVPSVHQRIEEVTA